MDSNFLTELEKKVERSLLNQGLCKPGDRIVVAVSGGPDSMALLRCLVSLHKRWNWTIWIGHVNHGLRGAESKEDEKFVQDVGKRLGVQVLIRRLFLSKEHIRPEKQSLQEYARTARYQAMDEMVQDVDATKLALGHTADDQAETVLMWMIRGCGTGGLGGMPPQRGTYVRPLLDIPRSEIVSYLEQRQEVYRLDVTNTQPVYLRNRIRRDLIPHLKTFSPGIVNVLTRQAHILRDDHNFLEALTDEAVRHTRLSHSADEWQFDRVALLNVSLPLRRRVVRQSLQQVSGAGQSPRFDVVERVLNCLEYGQSGWSLEYRGVQVFQEYDRIVFGRGQKQNLFTGGQFSDYAVPLSVPGEVDWLPSGQHIIISRGLFPIADQQVPSKVYLDADTFTPRLILRNWIPGDRFYPKGFGGRQKKLQDFFADMKLPRSRRSRVPLLVAPEGILWVGGLRADERFQVSPSTTSVIVAKMFV